MPRRKSQQFARAFIRPVVTLSAELQHNLCQKAAEEHDLDVTSVYECDWDGDPKDQRGAFIGDLREDEIALVARLDALGRSRKQLKGKRPMEDFGLVLDQLYRCADYVIELDSGVTSFDRDKWTEQVRAALNRITQGRTLTRKKARAMSRKARKGRPRGVVEEWLRPERAEERERWEQHWRDPKFPSAKAAFAALPNKLREEFGSVWTARRIFGPRKPGANFGRPRKKRAKR